VGRLPPSPLSLSLFLSWLVIARLYHFQKSLSPPTTVSS
jgi:hypothetical protein